MLQKIALFANNPKILQKILHQVKWWIRFFQMVLKLEHNDGVYQWFWDKHRIYMAFAENPFVTSTSIPTTAR
jgi:hypothetical protein